MRKREREGGREKNEQRKEEREREREQHVKLQQTCTIVQQVRQVDLKVDMEREVSCSSGPRVVRRALRHLARQRCMIVWEMGVASRRENTSERVGST